MRCTRIVRAVVVSNRWWIWLACAAVLLILLFQMLGCQATTTIEPGKTEAQRTTTTVGPSKKRTITVYGPEVQP